MTQTALNRAIARVAIEIHTEMESEGFETVAEMKKCYGMDNEDFKEYVSDIINDTMGFEVWIDEEDGNTVYSENGDEMSYRQFISGVYGEVKACK